MSERPMLLLSIVERDKGKKLIKTLEKMNIMLAFSPNRSRKTCLFLSSALLICRKDGS